MIAKNKLITTFAWLQLLISIAIAATIVWGYVTYRASLGQFAESVAASIVAVSDVVGRTSETIEAKQGLLDQTGKTLLATRNLIKELQVVAENQAKIAPQYAEGIRAASIVSGKLSGTLQSIGDGMLFSVPTSLRMEGIKPVVIMSHPLEKQAQALKTNAQDIKVVSQSLLGISAAITRDGQNLSSAFIATCEQALKLLEETEATLGGLKSNDLPKALKDLRVSSENLRNVSKQADVVGNIGEVLLVVGLLLAGWCFFNSLGTLLMLVNTQAVDSSNRTSPVAEQ